MDKLWGSVSEAWNTWCLYYIWPHNVFETRVVDIRRLIGKEYGSEFYCDVFLRRFNSLPGEELSSHFFPEDSFETLWML